MDQSPHKCIEQERAYTDGWRDAANGVISLRAKEASRLYAQGWSDADYRTIHQPHTLHPLWPMIDPRPAASGE